MINTTKAKQELATYERLKGIIEAYLHRRRYNLGHAVKSEDVVHDILIQLLCYDPEMDFRIGYREYPDERVPYIHRVTVNKCNKLYRRERALYGGHIPETLELLPESGIKMTESPILGQVGAEMILDLLPEGEKKVWRLKYEGYRHEDISKILGIPTTASKKRLQRGREKLLKLFR